jgi:hypothetical protein
MVCVEFPSARIIDLDHLHDLLAYTALTVVCPPDNCWRCTKESWVMALYCHEPGDLDSALLADPATVLWPETVPHLTAAHNQLHIPAIGSIEDRFSKTAGRDCLSQGCAHCHALFGDFFIHQETWANI